MNRSHHRVLLLVTLLMLLQACSNTESLRPPAAETATALPSADGKLAPPDVVRPYRVGRYDPGSERSRNITQVPPRTVEEANLEAEQWLGGAGEAFEAPGIFNTASGTARRECTATSEIRTRSGDWMLDTQKPGKVTLHPVSAIDDANHVVIRARALSGSQTYIHEVAVPAPTESIDARFQPPTAGEWLTVVTWGRLWGCFVLNVPVDTPYPRDTAKAETDGAQYPSRPFTVQLPTHFDETREGNRGPLGPSGGTSARRCVDSTEYWWVRSGELVARPVRQNVEAWEPDGERWKLLFFLLHQQPDDALAIGPHGDGLLVRATVRSAPDQTYVYENPLPHSAYRSETEHEIVIVDFPAFLRLPYAGQWTLVATAGFDWGCFILDVET